MQIYHTIKEIRDFVMDARIQGKTIGFVPTMGYFHDGHLELMRRAKKQCNVVIVSIFVNPTQFGPKEDFAKYPRDMERDAQMSREIGVDAIFNPGVAEMYPEGYCTDVTVERITEKLCGTARPGHFRGVATVVTKLFNIVAPDRAYFGQKDAQQVLVIKRMAADLDLDLEVITVTTRREADGLAMSSRNIYLDKTQRQAALVLSRGLQAAADAVATGEKNIAALRQLAVHTISSEPLAEIDYVEIFSYPELSEVEHFTDSALLAVAVRIGQTRLIDNIILGVQKNVFDNV